MPVIRIILLTLLLTALPVSSPLRAGDGKRHILPFELKDKGVTLTIRLNGHPLPLVFLLDTGADGMAIRKSLADSLGLNVGYTQDAYFVGGKKRIAISTGNTVHLSDSLSLAAQHIAIFDDTGGADGIIGLNLLKDYVTRFDFDRSELQLLPPDGFRPSPATLAAVPITMRRNLMLLSGELDLTGRGPVGGQFLLDTGAHYHLIAFSRFVRKNRLLLSGFKPEGMGSTVSMGHATPVYYGTARRFAIHPQAFAEDMPVTLQASSGDTGTADADAPDGSIGILFFQRYNFTIHLQAKQLYLEPRL